MIRSYGAYPKAVSLSRTLFWRSKSGVATWRDMLKYKHFFEHYLGKEVRMTGFIPDRLGGAQEWRNMDSISRVG